MTLQEAVTEADEYTTFTEADGTILLTDRADMHEVVIGRPSQSLDFGFTGEFSDSEAV